jgi:hypothetical protein
MLTNNIGANSSRCCFLRRATCRSIAGKTMTTMLSPPEKMF